MSMERTNEQHLSSQKLQGIHLMINDVFNEEKKGKDDDEVGQEKYVYDKLLEAMEAGDGELQDEMMDQILEHLTVWKRQRKTRRSV